MQGKEGDDNSGGGPVWFKERVRAKKTNYGPLGIDPRWYRWAPIRWTSGAICNGLFRGDQKLLWQTMVRQENFGRSAWLHEKIAIPRGGHQSIRGPP